MEKQEIPADIISALRKLSKPLQLPELDTKIPVVGRDRIRVSQLLGYLAEIQSLCAELYARYAPEQFCRFTSIHSCNEANYQTNYGGLVCDVINEFTADSKVRGANWSRLFDEKTGALVASYGEPAPPHA